MTDLNEKQKAEILDLAEMMGPLIDSLESEHVQNLVPALQDSLVEINGSIWIKHPWVNTWAPFLNQSNAIYNQKFSMMREYLSKRELHAYLFVVVERPWRFSTLENWYQRGKITREELRELLPSVWTDTEQPTTNYWSPIDLWQEVDFATDDEEEWAKVSETFTAYRGGRPEGIAWTLSKETGIFFANRFATLHKKPTLLETTVNKDQAYGYLSARGESEVILDPQEIEIREIPIALPEGGK